MNVAEGPAVETAGLKQRTPSYDASNAAGKGEVLRLGNGALGYTFTRATPLHPGLCFCSIVAA